MDKYTIDWPIVIDCVCGNTPAIYHSGRYFSVACEHCKRTGNVSVDELYAINMWNDAIKIELRDREEKDAHLRAIFAGMTRNKEESKDDCVHRVQLLKEEHNNEHN